MPRFTARLTAPFWKLIPVVLLLSFLTPASAHDRRERVEIQFIAISDWHAQLDPLFVFGEGSFGGAAELSAYWQMDRAANPNTLTLTAGDAYGASPPLSNFFNEEPAVRSMNLMGFDVDTFGNHNFDRGIGHLQQMIDLAEFQYVSANLKNLRRNLRGVKPFKIFTLGRTNRDHDSDSDDSDSDDSDSDDSDSDDSDSDDSDSDDDRKGIKVAVIGITNPEAPTLVFPGSFGTIEVTDPVRAAKRARRAARRQGAQVFVAITHLGVTGFDNGNPVGPLIDFAENVHGFDVIFGDHTDVKFSGIINDALVVENRSKGRTYARVHLTAEKRGRRARVVDRSVEFVDPFSDAVVPDPEILALLDPLRAELDVLLSVVIGSSTVQIPRADSCGNGAGRTCESLVGNVVTDSLRDRYGVDFALTNSGGLRADLTCPVVDNPTDFCPPVVGPNFDITDGQVLTVLPFGNSAVTLALNGAELKTMLENGVSQMPSASGRFPQISGLCFTYDTALAAGSRVLSAERQAMDGSCTGGPVDLTAASMYTLAENDFMANGGDGYPNFSGRATTRELLDQVTADYITANSPLMPTIQGRIECTSTGATVCPVVLP